MLNDERQIEFQQQLVDHTSLIYGFVRTMVLDVADAQDVFQETAVVLWSKYEELDAPENFGRWALGVARNKALQFIQQRGREKTWSNQELVEKLSVPPPANSDAAQGRRQALAHCIERLTERQQTVLRRCYQGSESVAQVAAALKRTPHSVYSSLRHIRVKLLDCVKIRVKTDS